MFFTADGTKLISLDTSHGQAIKVWDLRLIRKELAELNLDWESPSFRSRTLDGATVRSSNRRIISKIVTTNEAAAAVT